MKEPPLDRNEFERWRRGADRALRSAELQAADGLHNWACFSAEQAAQLAVKGLLHGIGDAPWGHDLRGLTARADEAGAELAPGVMDAVTRLTRHYIPARYPDAHPAGDAGDNYTASDAEQAIADARLAIEAIDRAWEAIGDA